MFGCNPNIKMRDEIIFGKYEPEKYQGGIRRFDNLAVDKIKKLVNMDFMYELDRQNDGPSVEVIVSFMEKYKGYGACGYAVSKDRPDYRVRLDGLEKIGEIAISEAEDFMKTFGAANEFTVTSTGVRCWYD